MLPRPKTEKEALSYIKLLILRKKYHLYQRIGQPHNSIRDIAYKENTADSDAYNFINACILAKLLNKRKKFRRSFTIRFTPKGEKLYDLLCQIETLFSEIEKEK